MAISSNDSSRVAVPADVTLQATGTGDPKNLMDSKTSAEIEKLLSEKDKIKSEHAKLQAEIIVLKRSQWLSPQVYVPLLVAIVATIGGSLGTLYGVNKVNQKDDELRIEKERLNLEISEANLRSRFYENGSKFWEEEARRLSEHLNKLSDSENRERIEKRMAAIEKLLQDETITLRSIAANTKKPPANQASNLR